MEDLFYKNITRRELIKRSCALGLGTFACGFIYQAVSQTGAYGISLKDKGVREASYYTKIDEETVKCGLCPHGCVLKNGVRSFCRVREPMGGKLYALTYELPCAIHIDPIEKKPIYHMLPGSRSFSIATAGCNLRCKFCQNWQISQSGPEETVNTYLSCEDLVRRAGQNNCKSISYTYSEPVVFYEYTLDAAKLAKSKGIKNICVTAGYISREPLLELCGYVDAVNVDLKAYDDAYLRDVCGQRLEPLLDALVIMKNKGVWVEITNLIVPTLNDNMNTIRRMCAWIKNNMGPDTPLHFSRFWPRYRLANLPPTPVGTLDNARNVAVSEGLNYVYIGNVPGHAGNNTLCPKCGKSLVRRTGFQIFENNISDSKCVFCDHKIAGIWE